MTKIKTNKIPQKVKDEFNKGWELANKKYNNVKITFLDKEVK